MKALALFSGGLDSVMAIKLAQEQGIEVIALNFVSHFFGGKNEKADAMAKQLGIQLEYIDFKEMHRAMLENPPSGYGKNMNPCIDCHAMMMKVAGELFEKYDAKFIITGEVLGQRPMSQNLKALRRVEKLAGMAGYVVRPLSAKNLPITLVEENGWLDREKLLDIQGRGRKRQIALAGEYGVVDFPSPGGGCLLTDPNYGRKLKILHEDEVFNIEKLFYILRVGRFFRMGKGRYLFTGRSEEDNKKLLEYQDISSLKIHGVVTPGPYIFGFGEFESEDIEFAKKLFSRYSKVKGLEKIEVKCNEKIVSVEALDTEAFQELIDKYLVL